MGGFSGSECAFGGWLCTAVWPVCLQLGLIDKDYVKNLSRKKVSCFAHSSVDKLLFNTFRENSNFCQIFIILPLVFFLLRGGLTALRGMPKMYLCRKNPAMSPLRNSAWLCYPLSYSLFWLLLIGILMTWMCEPVFSSSIIPVIHFVAVQYHCCSIWQMSDDDVTKDCYENTFIVQPSSFALLPVLSVYMKWTDGIGNLIKKNFVK